jgi:FkbM family methyltransferase
LIAASVAALAFRSLCLVGARFGGVRPRRVYHALARAAWSRPPAPDEFRWARDRWGFRFRLHPYYLIDRSILAFGGYDLSLLRFVRSRVRPGDVCLDVGANLGQVTVHLGSLVGSAGRVLSFEPLPHVRERLTSHVAANGLGSVVEVLALALCDRSGTATFHFAERGAANQGMGSLVMEHESLALACEVETKRLDDFVAERRLSRIDWIKVDIQGAEPLFLEGARETLLRHRPDLLVEVDPVDLRAGGSSSRELLVALDRLGYRAHALTDGVPGPPIDPRVVDADFAGENVYCTCRGTSA